jgi:hypothetical protein
VFEVLLFGAGDGAQGLELSHAATPGYITFQLKFIAKETSLKWHFLSLPLHTQHLGFTLTAQEGGCNFFF